MKKVLVILTVLFLSLGLISCSKKVEEVEPPVDVIKEKPEDLVKVEDFEIKYVDKAPDSLKNIYTDAKVKNNSKYPVLVYKIVMFAEYDQRNTYLSLYETMLPGETSHKIETITGVEGVGNKYTPVEHIYRILVDGTVYEIIYDVQKKSYFTRVVDEERPSEKEILVNKDEITLKTEVGDIDKEGIYKLNGQVKNNSKYEVSRYTAVLVSRNTNDVGYIYVDGSLKPGETYEFSRSLGEQGKVDFDIVKYEYSILKDGKVYEIEYDLKLESYKLKIKEAKN